MIVIVTIVIKKKETPFQLKINNIFYILLYFAQISPPKTLMTMMTIDKMTTSLPHSLLISA